MASSLRKSNLPVGYRCLDKLDKFIKVHKDKNSQPSTSNVIYKIYCKNCEASYVGQIKRQLRTRIKEHINNVRLDSSRHSVVSEHTLKMQHLFDWDNVKILDTETNYHKRIISEMIHIKEQKQGINLNTDTELLDESYFNNLHKLSNK